jgi:Tfp pilus assembly protein PilP
MRLVLAMFITVGAANAAFAQSQPAAAPAEQKAAEQKPAEQQTTLPAEKPVPEVYTYQADGRRDPFVNLLNTGTEVHVAPGRRPEGPAGMLLGEITVRGVMQSREALVAMIAGPDNKTYIVHQGDRLFDGLIKSITHDGLVVVQRVSDPNSGVKQREVQKLLRALEDAKE